MSRGARSLVLVSRSSPSPEASTTIDELEAAGATVRIELADIADANQVSRIRAIAHTDERPLRGVFHLAATVDDRLVADASDDSYLNVMRPKVAGALNLRRALRAIDLDVWVSFSSIATVVSQPGQGPYAAANAFLDASGTLCIGSRRANAEPGVGAVGRHWARSRDWYAEELPRLRRGWDLPNGAGLRPSHSGARVDGVGARAPHRDSGLDGIRRAPRQRSRAPSNS